MRLFVALLLPPEAVEHLRPALPAAPLRWTDPSTWHITLTFCGEVDDVRAQRLGQRLARAAARHPPLALQLSGAGAFPRPRAARAVWVGLAGDVERVRRLAAATTAAARRSGVTVADEKYRPHLTIARPRGGADVTPTLADLAAYDGPPWTATEIVLVRSYLGSAVRHEPVARFPLAARAPGG